jgi:DNA-binding NtrC family response regulator
MSEAGHYRHVSRHRMITRPYVSRSPVIQSVKVLSTPTPLILVITEDPSVMNAARTFIRKADQSLSIVWLTSVASACHRLEWCSAALIILDNRVEARVTADALDELHSAARRTRVVLLGEDAARL